MLKGYLPVFNTLLLKSTTEYGRRQHPVQVPRLPLLGPILDAKRHIPEYDAHKAP